MANKNLFETIEVSAPDKNQFDLTHDVKLSMDMGNLVPILALETIPGDSFNLTSEALVRMAPMIAPLMHRVDVFMHYFFVPNRLVWSGWEEYITDPNSGKVAPYLNVQNFNATTEKDLADYFGIPPEVLGPTGPDLKINAIPFAAYQCIYNEWYRDQNLIPEVNYKLSDGANTGAQFRTMRKRAWEHDYFTSALPWAQKSAAVNIPLGDVVLKDPLTGFGTKWLDAATGANAPAGNFTIGPNGESLPGTGATSGIFDPNGSLEVEPTTIATLRRAFKLQEWLERAARSGSRYIETIKAFFGVTTSDARLQRPEYICGSKTPIRISEVLNTTGQVSGIPQANMAGHGIAYVQDSPDHYFCEEHGYIIGIISILPKTAYQQGIARNFLKVNDSFEYYWEQFAHIGEQEIYNAELYAEAADPLGTFGYIPRYSEYKYMPNRVAGEFRTTLDHWHMGRIFAAEPALNQSFIEADPTNRIYAVEDPAEQKLWVQVVNKISALRPMPYFGSPKM